MKTATFFIYVVCSFYNLRFKRRQENLILKTDNENSLASHYEGVNVPNPALLKKKKIKPNPNPHKNFPRPQPRPCGGDHP